MSKLNRLSRRMKIAMTARAALESLESRIFLSAVPAPLTDTDVGNPPGGSASFNAGTNEFTITGAGFDIFAAADGFHYVFQPLTGDGTVVTRVDSDTANAGRSLAGLTIRSSLSPTAANLWVATRDTGRVFVDDRTSDGGVGTNVVVPLPPTSLPIFLKIQRVGNSITASSSTDGVNFTGLITDTINLPATALVGMAVSSQTGTTPTATATFGAFSVTSASVPPTATLTNAPTVVGPQLQPYQFTVTYADQTAINASTIAGSNITVTGPGGFSQTATLVSSGLTDGASVAAVYSVAGLTAPGQYSVNIGANQVANTTGTFVPAGAAGTFNVAADTAGPTVTLNSAPPITPSTVAPYTFQVTYSDNDAVNASTIGNSNLVVTGPGGFSQPATLVSTGLASGPNVGATYSINPLPTTPGTYTITSVPGGVADTSGNALAGGTVVGTFVVNAVTPPVTLGTGTIIGEVIHADGTIFSGRTVFIDSNSDGILEAGEPTAVSDSSATFAFRNLVAGTYKVMEAPLAGRSALEPVNNTLTVSLADGATDASLHFVDVPANAAVPAADLQVSVVSSPVATATRGKRGKLTLKITNNGTVAVNKGVKIALLASPTGLISDYISALRFARVSLHLKVGQSKNVTISYKYPSTLPVRSYKVVAAVDPDGLVAESNKANNTAVTAAVSVIA